MNPYLSSLNEYLDEMETIVAGDEISYEQDERLQELYYSFKEDLNDAFEFEAAYDNVNNKVPLELKKLKKRFIEICNEFETPDEIISSTMEGMYPNSDDIGEEDIEDFDDE